MATSEATPSGKVCCKWLNVLAQRSDLWVGDGINHADEPFACEMVVKQLFSGLGFLNWFRADGENGELLHEEVFLFGLDLDGKLSAACLNTNAPGLQLFCSDDTQGVAVEMTHGNMLDCSGFRTRVTLALDMENMLQYNFAWALPGEEIRIRSAARLRPSVELPSVNAIGWLVR